MQERWSPLTDRLRQGAEQLPYLPRALDLVWKSAPGWTVAWAALLLVQGVLPAASVYLTRLFVDRLVAALASHGAYADLVSAGVVAGLIAALLLLAQLLSSVGNWVSTVQSELVQDYISNLIHQQSLALDLAFYELPEYYDQLHRARAEATYRPAALLENVGALLQNAITLVAMAAVLLPYGWWLPPALLVSTLPALYVVLRYAVRQHEWRQAVTSDERRVWYYDWLLTAAENAAEIRLFGLGDHFRGLYQGVRRGLREGRLRLLREQALAELAAQLAGLIVTALALLWVAWRALQGLASLGDLALFYQAFSQGQNLMRSLLGSAGQMYGNMLFLGNLFAFLQLTPRVIEAPRPLPVPPVVRGGIRFKGVCFQYANSPRPAVNGLDLTIEPGEVIAIVGPNGAGKTTLVKLLCRLYDPDQGCIEWDGQDLRSLSISDLRRRIGILFQEPVHYSATVTENISPAGSAGIPGGDEVRQAASAALADGIIARLPRGYETALGRWFDNGLELSAGEWQRVALARAFYRDAAVLILDEPTSAMDPWAEAEWLAQIRAFTRGRITLIITHRLTTARCADMIHVMEGGRIVESGSHGSLLAAAGRYAELWNDGRRVDPRSEKPLGDHLA